VILELFLVIYHNFLGIINKLIETNYNDEEEEKKFNLNEVNSVFKKFYLSPHYKIINELPSQIQILLCTLTKFYQINNKILLDKVKFFFNNSLLNIIIELLNQKDYLMNSIYLNNLSFKN
jgi:hypothetical protein